MFLDKAEELNRGNILVISTGCCGCTATSEMVIKGVCEEADLLSVDSDRQTLCDRGVLNLLQIGEAVTGETGTHGDPEIGKEAVEESKDEITDAVRDYKAVIIVAGMGGGLGAGAAPAIAHISRGLGIPTLAVVTEPFTFEGEKMKRNAASGISRLRKEVDAMSVISGAEIVRRAGDLVPVEDAEKMSQQMILQIVQGICDMFHIDGSNVFSGVIQSGKVKSITAGSGHGENKVEDAVNGVIRSAELVNCDFSTASHTSMFVRGDISLYDINEIEERMEKLIGEKPDCITIEGTDETMKDEIRVTALELQ